VKSIIAALQWLD